MSMIRYQAAAMAAAALLAGCASSAALERERPQQSAGVHQGPQSQPTTPLKWTIVSDDWYSFTLAGVRAGWMRMVRESDGARYRSVTEMTMAFQQAGARLNADSYVEWIETHDGQPLRLRIARRNNDKLADSDIGSVWEQVRDGDPRGLLITSREWEFNRDTITRIGQRGDELIRSQVPMLEEPWLTPVKAEQFISRRIADDAREIEYGTVDAPDELRHLTIRSSLVGRADFALSGTLIPVTVWRTGTSLNPGQAISQYAQDGKLMYSSVDLGAGVLETRRCSRDEALAKAHRPVAAQANLPAIKPDQPLTAQSKAVYEVRLREGKLPKIPSAGAQTVEMAEDGRTARVTVDISRSSAATNPETVDAQLHADAPIVGSDGPVVRELAAQSLRETKGLSELELTSSSHLVVQRHFAARSAHGAEGSSIPLAGGVAGAGGEIRLSDDGAERAGILREVLRHHRIHARLVSGLAYDPPPHGDGCFEWRVWTQAMIDGRWLDVDPTGPARFDPGHILTGIAGIGSASADPDPLGFAKLLSRLEIRVISQE